MDVSIIIVNWNTRDLLRNCLRSIEACRGSLSLETFVVDNNSADGSRDMVAREFPSMTLINSGGNLGFAKGNNVALPKASGQFILFLNPDTELRDNSLRQMVDFLREKSGYGAIGCKIKNLNGTVQPLGLQWFPTPWTELVTYLAVSDRNWSRASRVLPTADPHVSAPVQKLFGACLLVRKQVLDQVGSFDERFFMYCEDVDLCYRISKGGWLLYYLADAEILHLGGAASSSASSSFSVLMMCESFSRFMRKHHGAFGALAYRAVVLIGSMARLVVIGLMGLASSVGLKSPTPNPVASRRKYVAALRWGLGLQKAVIKG